jgi:hypothetical protein
MSDESRGGGHMGGEGGGSGHIKVDGLYACELIPPRPTFMEDMDAEEQEILARHTAYWNRAIQRGIAVLYGPVIGARGAWGLGVFHAEDGKAARAFVEADPAVESGMATCDLGRLAEGAVHE